MTFTPNIKPEDVGQHVDSLAKIGNLGNSPKDGFLRAAWSDEESQAFSYIMDHATNHGLNALTDGLGNLYVRLGSNGKEVVQTGSHLDTVPNGGNYDGAAGIVASLEALKQIKSSNLALKKDIELVVWRGEESATFGSVYMGSKGAFGIASPDILNRKFKEETLEQAIVGQGFDPSYIAQNKPTLDKDYIDSIAAHLEFHIEQGKVLDSMDDFCVGVITSIRGPTRFEVVVTGDYDHSGATPMTTAYRRDANLAVAYMQVELDKLFRNHYANNKDLVQTVGVVKSGTDSALTKVSGNCYFTLDIRSDNKNFRDSYVTNEVLPMFNKVAKDLNVGINITPIQNSDPIESLDSYIQQTIQNSANNLGYNSILMPSGAGHDATVVGKQKKSDGSYVPIGMVFIPCDKGLSHCPEEYAKNEDIANGANVLAKTLYRLAK